MCLCVSVYCSIWMYSLKEMLSNLFSGTTKHDFADHFSLREHGAIFIRGSSPMELSIQQMHPERARQISEPRDSSVDSTKVNRCEPIEYINFSHTKLDQRK